MDDLLNDFLVESSENLEVIDLELVKFEKDPDDKAVLENIFRSVHTIKGTCGFLGLSRLELLTHATEDVLGKIRDGELAVTSDTVGALLGGIDRIKEILRLLGETGAEPSGDDSDLIRRLQNAAAGRSAARTPSDEGIQIAEAARQPRADRKADRARTDQEIGNSRPAGAIRVSVDLLNDLMDMVGELVLTRNQLVQMVRNSDEAEFAGPIQRLNKCTTELQQSILKSRMQPIGNAWAKLPRLVRDLSVELNKDIDLDMQGEETEIDRQLLELIKDPLTHMVRNAADHGIEPEKTRAETGKPAAGTIRLEAHHEAGQIIISVADDGRGVDSARLRNKAAELNIVDQDHLDRMDDSEVQQLIFHPGFSTANKVTNLSGRGVGLDVVRNNIERIGGTVELTSRIGEGSTFTIRIPLTLAIIKALVVEAAGQAFAIPQVNIRELVRVGPPGEYRTETLNGVPALRYRDGALPLISLGEIIGVEDTALGDSDTDTDYAVIAQAGPFQFAISVDRLLDQQEIVVKPLAPLLKDIGLYAGATILGDGQVILILDPNGLAGRCNALPAAEPRPKAISVTTNDAGVRDESILIFRAGAGPAKAVPLSMVVRLETFESAAFEWSAGRCTIRYHGMLMQIVGIDPNVEIGGRGRQPVIVFADGDDFMGVAVDEIVDIVSGRLELSESDTRQGILGAAVIGGRSVEVIDVAHFIGLLGRGGEMASKDEAEKSRASVLLIEDSSYFQKMLQPLLSRAGYEVRCVESADEALELRAAGEDFDLIISDLELPGMSGFEFASQVSNSGAWSGTPIVALANLVSDADVARGRAVGFSDHVAKFDRRALLQSVSKQLRRKGNAA